MSSINAYWTRARGINEHLNCTLKSSSFPDSQHRRSTNQPTNMVFTRWTTHKMTRLNWWLSTPLIMNLSNKSCSNTTRANISYPHGSTANDGHIMTIMLLFKYKQWKSQHRHKTSTIWLRDLNAVILLSLLLLHHGNQDTELWSFAIDSHPRNRH